MVSEELWIVWSDTRKGWCPHIHAEEALAKLMASQLARWGSCGACDWRPVRIPPPSQFEATADLLAALKDLLWMADAEPTTEEDIEWGEKAIAAAKAAIAKATGEGE